MLDSSKSQNYSKSYKNPLIAYSNDFKSAKSMDDLEELIQAKKVNKTLESLCEDDRKLVETSFINPLYGNIKKSYNSLKKEIDKLKKSVFEEYADKLKSELKSFKAMKGEQYIEEIIKYSRKYSNENVCAELKEIYAKKSEGLIKDYVLKSCELIDLFSKVMDYSWQNFKFAQKKEKKETIAPKRTKKNTLLNEEKKTEMKKGIKSSINKNKDLNPINASEKGITTCPVCKKDSHLIESIPIMDHGDMISMDKYDCGCTKRNN